MPQVCIKLDPKAKIAAYEAASAASLIISITILLLAGNATIAYCAADAVQDAGNIRKYKKDLYTINNRLNEDPAYNFGEWLSWTYRFIMDKSYADTSLIDKYIKLFAEIIQDESLKLSIRTWAAYSLVDFGNAHNKMKQVLPIAYPVLLERLRDKSMAVRLQTADKLFDLGYKKEAYPIYVDILNKPNLREWLDKEYRLQYEERKIVLSTSIEHLKSNFAKNKNGNTNRFKENPGMELEDSLEIERRKQALNDIQSEINYIEITKFRTLRVPYIPIRTSSCQ